MLEGIAAQKDIDKKKLLWHEVMTLEEIEGIAEMASVELDFGNVQEEGELHDEDGVVAFDDVSGENLCPNLVRKARAEELEYFRQLGVYEVVKVSECVATTNKAPITTRWIDTNKGDSKSPNYRSRLVAREYNTKAQDDLFAATHPAEALKMLLSKMATKDKGYKLLYADVSRAYFYARSTRPTYIKLPEEDARARDKSLCGRLRLSLYGTRDAAQHLHQE